jgi:alkaline phosphatase D
MKLSWSLVLLSSAAASASYAGNLNYRSPSAKHPSLGVSVDRLAKREDPESQSCDPSKLKFTHGVASGDPYADSVILWTRCSPSFDDVHSNISTSGLVPLYNPVPIYSGDGDGDAEEDEDAVSNAPVCMDYKVSEDESFEDVASEGTVYTSSDVDYTVKVLAVYGLETWEIR